jgi:hypothetical protein
MLSGTVRTRGAVAASGPRFCTDLYEYKVLYNLLPFGHLSFINSSVSFRKYITMLSVQVFCSLFPGRGEVGCVNALSDRLFCR